MLGWKCHKVDIGKETTGLSLQVGDMFYAPTKEEVEADDALPEEDRLGLHWPYFHCKSQKLSPYYYRHNRHRRPIMVMMPGRALYCIDAMQQLNGIYFGDGWIVTGDIPNITMSPSIDIGTIYHGFIINGEITNDVSGNAYDEIGNVV